MPKVTVEIPLHMIPLHMIPLHMIPLHMIPLHIIDDVNAHVGAGKKFVNFSDAVRTALRKMLDQLDEVDRRRGRILE